MKHHRCCIKKIKRRGAVICFFLVQHPGRLWLFIEYKPRCYIITKRRPGPLRLGRESISLDQIKEYKFFTKLDLQNGYNNIQIKDGDQWKVAFKIIRGLYEPIVMYFGLCNSLATFQAFIDNVFHKQK